MKTIILRSGKYIQTRKLHTSVEADVVFPLNSAEFMGVSGVGIPRDVGAFLAAMYSRPYLDTCTTGTRNHRRGATFEGDAIEIPCESLNKWIKRNDDGDVEIFLTCSSTTTVRVSCINICLILLLNFLQNIKCSSLRY